jgi:hypothetical protein
MDDANLREQRRQDRTGRYHHKLVEDAFRGLLAELTR